MTFHKIVRDTKPPGGEIAGDGLRITMRCEVVVFHTLLSMRQTILDVTGKVEIKYWLR